MQYHTIISGKNMKTKKEYSKQGLPFDFRTPSEIQSAAKTPHVVEANSLTLPEAETPAAT